MAEMLVTRRVLARELALHAATRPLNLAVPAGVAAAALLLSVWLLPIALLVYCALVVTTVLDGEAAESVGREVYAKARTALPRGRRSGAGEWIDSGVSGKLALAYEADRRIRQAVAESPVPLVDVETELDRLLHDLETLARQSDRVAAYLAAEDEAVLRARLDKLRGMKSGDPQIDRANGRVAAALEDQLHARVQLSRQLTRLDAEMDHIAATLGVIHAQIVRMSVAEEALTHRRVAEQVRELRRAAGAAADALDDAYREVD